MFRLMVISTLASIVAVQGGTILTPVVGKLVSEEVVGIARPAPARVSLVAERTIEAHGHNIVHDARPVLAVAEKPLLAAVEPHVIAAPAIAAREFTYAVPPAPIYYSTYPHQLIAEKTVSSYGHSIQHVA